jgi:hypothetical protein
VSRNVNAMDIEKIREMVESIDNTDDYEKIRLMMSKQWRAILRNKRDEFEIGETVEFTSKKQGVVVGKLILKGQKNWKVDVAPRTTWTVSANLIRKHQ